MQDSRKSPIRLKGQAHSESTCNPLGRVDIRDLIGQRRQITISHGGSDYVLRITRNGKLILTK